MTVSECLWKDNEPLITSLKHRIYYWQCNSQIADRTSWQTGRPSAPRSPRDLLTKARWTQMYVDTDRPASLTLTGIRKTHFGEFSGGAASLFNLRQQHSELSSLRAAGLTGVFVRGIQLTEQIALFTYKGFLLSRPINRDRLWQGITKLQHTDQNTNNIITLLHLLISFQVSAAHCWNIWL